jgi:hypothetical protein
MELLRFELLIGVGRVWCDSIEESIGDRQLEIGTFVSATVQFVELSYHTEKETLHIATTVISFLHKRASNTSQKTHFHIHQYRHRHDLGILPATLVVCVIYVSPSVRTARRSDRALVVRAVHISPSLRTARRCDRVLVTSAHVEAGIE